MDNCKLTGAHIVIHNTFDNTVLSVTEQRSTMTAYSMRINSNYIITEEVIGRLIYVSATDWRLVQK